MKGASNISELRLSVLNKLVTTFQAPPALLFSNLFPDVTDVSDTIKWESQEGNRGMTPFKAPGGPSPRTAPVGVAQHNAFAAFLGEKEFYDESFLNNLRKEGTESEYLAAQQRLARELKSMTNRCRRRKEFMYAKMFTAGTFTYYEKDGIKAVVDYDIPDANEVSLGTNYLWSTGSSKDIMGDIMDGKIVVSDACGGLIDYFACNSVVLQYMAQDATLQTLLQSSSFGKGNLFKDTNQSLIGVQPAVLGSLLGIKNFIVYDEKYTVSEYLTAALAASGTTVYVGNAADFEAGTATLHDTSAGTSEAVTISAIDPQAGTITVGATTAAFKQGEDKITQTLPYIPNDKILMYASQVDGQAIADFRQAPYGLQRHWGLQTHQWETTDPDGIFIRVEDKGLPVLYQRDAIYILDVA